MNKIIIYILYFSLIFFFFKLEITRYNSLKRGTSYAKICLKGELINLIPQNFYIFTKISVVILLKSQYVQFKIKICKI